MLCGSCDTAWSIVCGLVESRTCTLLSFVEGCRCEGGPMGKLWDYIDDDCDLNREIPPPEYHPGKPRNELHHTRYPGPYAKWLKPDKPVRRSRRVTVPDTPDAETANDPWGWE